MANITYQGSSGDDIFTGSNDIADRDIFLLDDGGNDTVSALDGDDVFRLGAALNAADELDGGDGFDEVTLRGDYAFGLIFAPDTLLNIEKLNLTGGFDYNIISDDLTVAAGQTLEVNGTSALVLAFNGGGETDGHFDMTGTVNSDTLIGGALRDTFDLSAGGADEAIGNRGSDIFRMGASLRSGDRIDGGAGKHDRILLGGDYTGAHALVLSGHTLQNIETMRLGFGHSYDITVSDGTVGNSNKAMVIDGVFVGAGNSITFDASQELQGHYFFRDGQGDDNLRGGFGVDSFDLASGGNNIVQGGFEFDLISCGPGFDTLVYSGGIESSSTTFDNVGNFNADVDKFDLAATVSSNPVALSGAVNFATFNADIAGIVGSNTIALINVTSGGYSGRLFLFVEGNATSGYQSFDDYLINVKGYTGTLDSTDFI